MHIDIFLFYNFILLYFIFVREKYLIKNIMNLMKCLVRRILHEVGSRNERREIHKYKDEADLCLFFCIIIDNFKKC